MIHLKNTDTVLKFNEYASYVLKDGYVFDKENESEIATCIDILEKNETGLFIVGNPGSGKTLFFEMMQKITHPQSDKMFVKLSVLDIVLKFNNKDIGHNVFRQFGDKNVFFDDLGTEQKGRHYGESVEVFEKFIQFRYDLFRAKKIKTHFTTNLDKKQITERYGMRCTSRLNEMCAKVILGGKSDYTDRRQYRNFIELPPVHHEITNKYGKIDYEEYKRNNPPGSEFKGLGQLLKDKLK